MSPDQAERWMKRLAADGERSSVVEDPERVWAMAMLEAELEARRRAESPLELMRLATQTVAGATLAVSAYALPLLEAWLRGLP